MRLAGLLFIIGSLCGLVLAPSHAATLLSLAAALGALLKRGTRALSALLIGVTWAGFAIDGAERTLLSAAQEDDAQLIAGRVAAFPMPGAAGFVLELDDSVARGRPLRSLPKRVSVAWRDAPRAPRLGDWCELHVRLQRPHGYANPGGGDVERSAVVRHVGATGYVIAHPANQCARIATRREIDGLRAWLARRIDAAVVDSDAAAAIKALAVDDRSALTRADWDIMRRTGTAHLLAISGLQITLAAGWCFALCRWVLGLVWSRRQDYLVLRAAWLMSAAAAWGYTLVAGAGVPSVRAAVMVGFAAGAALQGRRALSWDTLLASLVALTVWDPLGLLGSGLWLSFAAVAVLVMLSNARRCGSPWRLAWRTHVVLAIAMAPLTALLFGEVPWCAPLANLIAVPWSNVFVVPLVLAGMLCAGWAPMAATLLWDCAARLWSPLSALLEWMAATPTLSLPQEVSLVSMVLASAGLLVLALPRAVPGRALGALLLVAVLLPHEAALRSGEFRVTLFDVGQGLAVLVRTAHHALLYDSGPRWWAGGDAGASIVVPALRALGIRQLDQLLISHADLDHAGGAASILARLPVATLLTNTRIAALRATPAQPCHAPLHWQVDGVSFEILHPTVATHHASRNDGSCVLAVRGVYGRALLTGDIEIAVERELVQRVPAALVAELVVVPHHGSATSSSPEFLRAVQPRLALIGAGLNNRYHLPQASVVARYHALGAVVMNSAQQGAVSIDVVGEGLRVSAYRAAQWGWWRKPRP